MQLDRFQDKQDKNPAYPFICYILFKNQITTTVSHLEQEEYKQCTIPH